MTTLPNPFLHATPQENAAAIDQHAPAMAAAENSISALFLRKPHQAFMRALFRFAGIS